MKLANICKTILFCTLLPMNAIASDSIIDARRAYQAKDYAKLDTILQALVIKGNAEAMESLANLYQNGDGGFEKSEDTAWIWAERAVARYKIEKKYSEAINTLQPFAKSGHVDALIEHAVLFVEVGSEDDRAKAKAFIKQKAKVGIGRAQLEHAKIAYKDAATREEGSAARVKWLKLSAEAGYAPGQNFYGAMFNFNIKAAGITKDLSKRFYWQKKSADQGFTGGQYNTGYLYSHGMGTERSAEKAVSYYSKASEGGHFKAMMELASAYKYGNGTQKNTQKAIAWYIKVSEGVHYTNELKYEADRQIQKLTVTP